MQKKLILLSLATITIFINSMDTIEKNEDVLIELTKQIATVNEWNLKNTSHCLRSLALARKALHSHYTQESTGKKNVKMMAIATNVSYYDCAKTLGYKNIANKITTLFSSPHLPLKEQDLLDRWYLNATNSFYGIPMPLTLLHEAIEFTNQSRLQMLLTARKINLHNPQCENLLRLALRRYCCASQPEDVYFFFNTIIILLENKFNPDTKIPTHMKQEATGLAWASSKGDEKLANLLLSYNANPYETIVLKDSLVNCFDLEQGKPKGWLTTLYKEIKK